jgi:hypothetical protein
VDTLLTNQNKLIATAIKVQNNTNMKNLRKRYATYKNKPVIKARDTSAIRKTKTQASLTAATVTVKQKRQEKPKKRISFNIDGIQAMNSNNEPLSLTTKKKTPLWSWDGVNEVDRVYVKAQNPIEPNSDSIVEFNADDVMLTTYEVGDYVLRKYSPTKIGQGPPMKYSSWWKGPYIITDKIHTGNKYIYSIRNLITARAYRVDVMHIKPFYYDPKKSIPPLNIAAKDTDEYVVDHIVTHDFEDPNHKLWRVRWAGYDMDEDTWEPFEHLKDVEAFHQYCIQHKMHQFLPNKGKPRGKKIQGTHKL